MSELVEKIVLIVAVLAILVLIIFICWSWYVGVKEYRLCAKWETKVVHQKQWTQFIYTGKVMVPIVHPARDVERRVCTQPK